MLLARPAFTFVTIVGVAGVLSCMQTTPSVAKSSAESSPQISQATGKPNSRAEQRERITEAVNNYAIVSGGWYVNQRCRILPDQTTREFEWHATSLTRALRRFAGSKALGTARDAARRGAESKKFEKCDAIAKKAVADTLALARRMSKAIVREPYKAGFSEWKSYLRQFRNAAVRVNLEQRCKTLRPEILKRMQTDLGAVESALRKRTTENAVSTVLADAKKLATADCNDATKTRIRNAAKALPQLKRRMVSAY
jgi:hypothetical protein